MRRVVGSGLILLILAFALGAAGGCGGQQTEAFTDNGDGTVTDTSTGLMWQQGTKPTTLALSSADQPVQSPVDDAKAYCEGLTLAGYDDWRLATIDELRSLYVGCDRLAPGGACAVHDGCYDTYDEDTGWHASCDEVTGCYGPEITGCLGANGPGVDGCYMSSAFGAVPNGQFLSASVFTVMTKYGLQVVDWEAGFTGPAELQGQVVMSDGNSLGGGRVRCVREP